jgi:pyridoxal 5-phosphate dependent beta-lyase
VGPAAADACPLARPVPADGNAGPVRLLEPTEASVAGRAGLCAAVRQHLDAGPPDVWGRLAGVGMATREILGGLPGWQVCESGGAPSAITALRPADGQDVPAIRARLLAGQGIVTTACLPARAPREMTQPLLRVSPHVDCTTEDLIRLRWALSTMT